MSLWNRPHPLLRVLEDAAAALEQEGFAARLQAAELARRKTTRRS
ncbi:MAG TPA: hypothetical protein VM847_11875 [Tahibacter sp.]|nr:hypothetical protein [Tahibacter sp.]